MHSTDRSHRSLPVQEPLHKPKPGEPKIWFTSMKTMSNYGIVELKRKRNQVRPVANATEFRIFAQ
jgi:predicted transcriptional regulator